VGDLDGAPDALAHRWLDNGALLLVVPLTFQRARLTINHEGSSYTYDDGW
jgi:hypothetical protein